MGKPLIFVGIDVEFGAEWMGIHLALGAGVDERPFIMTIRSPRSLSTK